MRRISSLGAALLAVSLLVSACKSVEHPPLPSDAAILAAQPEYLIGIGDALSVKLYYNSELNEDVLVRPDGRISLQLIGEVKVAGQTPRNISEYLKLRYREHLPNADVAVIVRQFASMKAYVGGEVARPQMVQLDGNMTLADAVIAAGGQMETAALDSVVLLRAGEGGTREAYKIDLKKILDGEAETPVLRAYDVVFLPKSGIAKLGMWVDLYINRIVPRNARFNAIYNIDPITASGALE